MMRFITALTAVLLTAACAASVAPSSGPTTNTSATAAPAGPTPSAGAPADVCHGLAHVYNPSRLHELAACVIVRGVIVSVRQEPDGDLHVRLRVDADQRDPRGGRFTNSINDADQGGALVLEPVCEGPVIQPDAVACTGFRNSLVVPPVGTHVAVTGPWVLDAPHGWNEIHPLEKVEVLR